MSVGLICYTFSYVAVCCVLRLSALPAESSLPPEVEDLGSLSSEGGIVESVSTVMQGGGEEGGGEEGGKDPLLPEEASLDSTLLEEISL